MLTLESDDYKKGYQNALNDFQNQMNLRNRNVPIVTKEAIDQASTSG